MARQPDNAIALSAQITVTEGYHLPATRLTGVMLLHPALANTTTTIEVAREAAFTTAYILHETQGDADDDDDSGILVADPDAITAQDLTDELRSAGGLWVRLRSLTAIASTTSTGYWRVTIDN